MLATGSFLHDWTGDPARRYKWEIRQTPKPLLALAEPLPVHIIPARAPIGKGLLANETPSHPNDALGPSRAADCETIAQGQCVGVRHKEPTALGQRSIFCMFWYHVLASFS